MFFAIRLSFLLGWSVDRKSIPPYTRKIFIGIIMSGILKILQLGSAFLLIIAILLQQRGTGLGAAFGGEGNVYRTKRGIEKKLFFATIALAIIFLLSSLGVVLLPR